MPVVNLGDQKPERPEFVTEEMLLFLDSVRESGEINMFGAALWVGEMFPELTKSQSRKVHVYWMKTFGERHPK